MAEQDLDQTHARPAGTTDAEVEAAGKMSEALETIEKARGVLLEFHQLLGRSDFLFEEAVELIQRAGHSKLAERVDQELVGRNVIAGRWTFQLVEEFEDGYYATARGLNQTVADELVGGRRHVYEAEMKQQRRSRGRAGHERTPAQIERNEFEG